MEEGMKQRKKKHVLSNINTIGHMKNTRKNKESHPNKICFILILEKYLLRM